MSDDLRQRYAEALAEKFTWPAFKSQLGRYPEAAKPETADLTGKHMRAFFVDEGGQPGFRPVTCNEAAEVCAAVRDTELETLRRANEIQRDQIRAYINAHQEDTAKWSRDLEAARASIARVREVHDVHSCDRDGHIHRSTPTPCVNDGVCSCGRRAPCPTLAALDSPKDVTDAH